MTLSTAPVSEQLQSRCVERSADQPRVLFPFAGPFDQSAVDLAVRLAKADDAMLVAAYLTVVPLRYHADSPRHEPSWLAGPLLDAVERAALGAGVMVTTRIGRGRTLRHALARLLADERFDSMVATAPGDGRCGFSESDIAWLIAHAPTPALVLKPAADPNRVQEGRYVDSSPSTPRPPIADLAAALAARPIA